MNGRLDESDVPRGWKRELLQDLVSMGAGSGVPAEDPTMPFIGMEHVASETGAVWGHGDPLDYGSSSFIAEEGQVLYGRLRPYLNKVFVAPEPVYTSREFIPMTPLPAIDARFLAHRLRAPDFVAFAVGLNTGDRPRVKWPQMKAFEVATPPLAEQERIVEILEEHLSRLDAALDSIRTIRKKSDRFERSLLLEAFRDSQSGSASGSWPTMPLGDVVDVLDSQRVPVNAVERSKRAGSIPYYGATGQVGTIDAPLFNEDLVLLGEDGVQFLDPYKQKAYSISGPAWVNNHAHVLRVKQDLMRQDLLVHFLNVFDYEGAANGTTRLKLTQAAMRKIEVVVPPRSDQARIAERIDAALSGVRYALTSAEAVLADGEALRRSLLHAAFTGRLTEDWREQHRG